MKGRLWFEPVEGQRFDGYWVMAAHPHIHMRAKRVFPKLAKDVQRELRLTNSLENARELEWFLERFPLEMADHDRARLQLASAGHKAHEAALEAFFDPTYKPSTIELALPPRPYQVKEAEILRHTGALLVGDDVGLGKTITGICAAVATEARPAVIVTLTHLPKQWEAQFAKFAPELYVYRVRKGQAYPLPKKKGRSPDVIVLNYHKLAGWAAMLADFAKLVVYDEVQELRHDGTLRAQGATVLSEAATYRLGLSATPFYNYGGEMFNVMNALKPGCLGTWEEFFTEWCTDSRDGKSRIKDPKAFGAWLRAQGLMVRHTRSQVGMDLPPVSRITHYVDADEAALDKVEANAVELAKRLLSGAVAGRGERMREAEELSVLLRQATGIAKAPYVADFVRMVVEGGERVVLFGWHRAVYDIWKSKLADLNPVMYTGSETPAQKEAAKNAFMSGESRVFIISLRAGAGIDGLQGNAHVCVFGELDYSPAIHEQGIGRIHRFGQAEPVMAYFLVTDSGSDPIIVDINHLKRSQIDGVRDADNELLEALQVDVDIIPMLAQRYLKQVGHKVPAPEAADTATAQSLFQESV